MFLSFHFESGTLQMGFRHLLAALGYSLWARRPVLGLQTWSGRARLLDGGMRGLGFKRRMAAI